MTSADTRKMLSLLVLCFVPVAGYSAPLPARIEVCTEYNCDRPVSIPISTEAWHAIGQSFNGIDSAATEREAIRQAIAHFENMAGKQTGTWRDRPGNEGDPADAGQLDCVAESRNSDRYLRLLEAQGLLRWHQVMERRSRHPWLFDFHWTAVIRERGSDQYFAVDSWYLANGDPPYVQPLEAWLRGVSPE